jgi:hypothetical protein
MALTASVDQFIELNDSLSFEESSNVIFISLKEIQSNTTPNGVIVSNTGITFTITGSYGEDIASNDEYLVRTKDGKFITYYNYNDLINAEYEHLIKFSPDASHDKTFKYSFLVDSVLTTYEQKVYLNPSRHYTRLRELVNKEAPNASSS